MSEGSFDLQKLLNADIRGTNEDDLIPMKAKHRLSNEQTTQIQLVGIVLGGILPWVVALLLIGLIPFAWAAVGAGLVNIFTLLLSLQLYKAEFDRQFLYLSRRTVYRQVDLRDVEKIAVWPFPVSLVFNTAYILTLTYAKEGRNRKAFILTAGQPGWKPTVDAIPQLGLFRAFVSDRQLGQQSAAVENL